MSSHFFVSSVPFSRVTCISPAPGDSPVYTTSAPRFRTWITSKYPLASDLAWVDFLKICPSRAIRDSAFRANGIFHFQIWKLHMWCKMTGIIGLVGTYCLVFVLTCLLFELFDKMFNRLTIALMRFVKNTQLSGGELRIHSYAQNFKPLIIVSRPIVAQNHQGRACVRVVSTMGSHAHFCPWAWTRKFFILVLINRSLNGPFQK